jgi:hypothetical protein
MSTVVADIKTAGSTEYARYKALSSAAVAALVVGILSLMAFLHPWFVALPIVGVLLAVVALKKIRANPEELTGEPVAKAGLALCLLFGITGPSYQAYVYATEVPEWAQRISYAELQPDPDVTGQLVPPSAMALNGKKVFIKGFIYPGQQTDGIKQFVLCRDQGDCCFGGNPKVTDRIEVTLVDPLTVGFSPRQLKVAGTFRVERTPAAGGVGAVYYHLDAEYVQ